VGSLLSRFSLCRLSQPHARATAVLIDEFDAPSSQGVLSLQFAHLQGVFAEMQRETRGLPSVSVTGYTGDSHISIGHLIAGQALAHGQLHFSQYLSNEGPTLLSSP
jgi:hypothetical protein